MDFSLIRAAEEALLTGDVRRNAAQVEALLHPDFMEIGRSGGRWTRDETIAALAAEGAHAEVTTDEWKFDELAPGLVLLTYRIHGDRGVSRHSSIWDSSAGQLRMRFHQGTFVTP